MRNRSGRKEYDLPWVRAKGRRVVRRAVRAGRTGIVSNPAIACGLVMLGILTMQITNMMTIPIIAILLGAALLMANDFFRSIFGAADAPPARVDPPVERVGKEAVHTPTATQAVSPPTDVRPYWEDERIPSSVRPKVLEVVRLVDKIESRTANGSLLDDLAVEIRKIRDSHLPKLLGSYYAIPPEHRAEIYRETGKSASVGLGEAVEIMRKRAESISLTLATTNINEFADNLRFVNETYVGNRDPLGLDK